MKRELNYFSIDGSLGWNQYWFRDRMMYYGGCAAVTACDLCIHLAREKGMPFLYPSNAEHLNREAYLAFAQTMKGYLGPRWRGIDTLDVYCAGLLKYWQDVGAESLELLATPGTAPWTEAREVIRAQIDAGMIVPFLLLRHKGHALRAYQWHWFNLAGYEELHGEFYVKAVTYGSFRWFNLQELWDTGRNRKGGVIQVFVK